MLVKKIILLRSALSVIENVSLHFDEMCEA